MTTIIQKSASTGQKLILDVRQPTNAPTSTALFYGTVDNSAELATYAANYSAATGIYTVPASGHKNVRIKASQTFTTAANANLLQIQIDGVKRMQKKGNTAFNTIDLDYCINNLVSGQTIKVIANGGNEGGGATGEFSDYLQIFADR